MRSTEFPVVKDIVLLGGGHAHVTVLRRFGMLPINGARITLISPDAHTPYSGMLPGLIADHYTFDEAHIDLAPLARFAGARFLVTSVSRIDPDQRLVYCADGRPPIAYDVLSVNTGSTPVFDPALSLERTVIPVKPVSEFLIAWQGLKERVIAEPSRRVGIVGAGAGGIELLLSMQYALSRHTGSATAARRGEGSGIFHAFTRDEVVLKTHGDAVRKALGAALSARGVAVHTGFNVTGVTAEGVSDGTRTVALDEVIWVTGAQPPDWFAQSGLKVDERGFLAVNGELQSISHPDIFGAGDAVTMIEDRRPKSGVFAVRQGPVLARNLRARVMNQRLKTYRPQKAFLGLISTGDQFAIASYAGWSITGEWVWRWKDRIDRSFMRTFNELPEMTGRSNTQATVADVPDEVRESQLPNAMRCGGCGAKVGALTLGRVLAEVNIARHDGLADARGGEAVHSCGCGANKGRIVLGVGDDAAAIEVPKGKILVQTIDAFPAMIDDPYVFGKIAANHCLGDIFAMGAVPHSALASVTLPFAPAAKREADLVQLLAGAKSVLDDAGCTIIGGHTGEGAEVTLGFAINGLGEEDKLLRKSGLVPDLALVLTKPLGTGALFAANRRGKAKGRWVENAVVHALQSNAAAAVILRQHGALAMTDVTGFGLAGHLEEMLDAADLAATIRLHDVPLLDGASFVVHAGIVSSLQRDNLGMRGSVDASVALAASAEFQLLFDPQTAGGLLAGLPQDAAEAVVAALHSAGYHDAAVIGETLPRNAAGGAAETSTPGARIMLV